MAAVEDGAPQLAVEGIPLATIRGWVRGLLDDLHADDLDDCLLVVTELVSNAFDHADKPRHLRVRRGTLVRIEVDDSTHDELIIGHSRLGEHRGRGLVLVDNLALAWGVDHSPHGKTVWADLPGPRP
ncbi:ATP-binding protein [Actinosynnema sp. NPDC020468]|uniref:ATP-binding protein n=1 Tax=Actinosynnema sp. NPDC020468 TaxID=3154488 RepID=UPI00340EF43C